MKLVPKEWVLNHTNTAIMIPTTSNRARFFAMGLIYDCKSNGYIAARNLNLAELSDPVFEVGEIRTELLL